MFGENIRNVPKSCLSPSNQRVDFVAFEYWAMASVIGKTKEVVATSEPMACLRLLFVGLNIDGLCDKCANAEHD